MACCGITFEFVCYWCFVAHYAQGRLIQWARWARVQDPKAQEAPKQPIHYFLSREIIVTNCVIFYWPNK